MSHDSWFEIGDVWKCSLVFINFELDFKNPQ